MTAQAHFPHGELQGKSGDALQEMLFTQRGINWNDLPVGFRRGRVVERVESAGAVSFVDKRTGETRLVENVTRHAWRIAEPPVFSQDRDYLLARIPAREASAENSGLSNR